jgi:prepilin-type N-terminal cleavage/methylation domain-containing protein
MRRRGFTLIEVLLSLALVGIVLVGLNVFVFSMGELWGKNTDVRLFDQHVRAVTRYLQREMLRASLPPAASVNATPVGVQPVTPSGGSQSNLVTYMVLWHSDLENHFNDDPPRETLVSPFVTMLGYDYYDTDFNKWTTESSLRTDSSGNPLPPQRLRVTFYYDRLTRVALIAIPATQQGLPNPW